VLTVILYFFIRNYRKENNKTNEIGYSKETEAQIYNMITTLDEIDRKLDSIRDTKGYMVLGPNGNSDVVSKRQQIFNNITMVNTIIEDNAKKIKLLEQQLQNMKNINLGLKERLERYSQSNEDIFLEMSNLKFELEQTEHENSQLSKTIQNQTKTTNTLKQRLDKAEESAYTSFYIYDDRKRLKELNLFDTPDPSSLPENEFEKLDSREDAIIPTHAKKVRLVSSHANNSYVWKDDEEGKKNLCILDPAKFWQNSKYLVIEVK